MKDNILSLPDELIGKIFKEIYTPYEKNLRTIFEHQREVKITPQQVVEVFHRHGLSDYAIQIYIAFYGLYLGIQRRSSKEVYQEVHSLIAAYRISDELGVDVSDINPEKALEYYNQLNK